MYSTAFRRPVVALAAGTLALAPAATAQATQSTSGSGKSGKATAVVLRTGLDVSLLSRTVDVPLRLTLNEVRAPAAADRTALSARLDGVDHGRAFSVLRADAAVARATADRHGAEGYVRLVNARVHVPGLPLLGLIEAGTVTSRATCRPGRRPTAQSEVLGRVLVLGKRVEVSAGGPTRVTVPGVGQVRLELSPRAVTSRTAAATALELTVAVNPLDLNVGEVNGHVTLAGATCRMPRGGAARGPSHGPSHGPGPGAAADPGTGKPSTGTAEPAGVKPSTGTGAGTRARAQNAATTEQGLAETGSAPATPYVALGAAGLLVVGSVVACAARRRRPVEVTVRD